MSGAMLSRVQKEVASLASSPPPGVAAWPADGIALTHLEATIEGPVETVYEGGLFKVDIQIPDRCGLFPSPVRSLCIR